LSGGVTLSVLDDQVDRYIEQIKERHSGTSAP
jgi:hypothetical protein